MVNRTKPECADPLPIPVAIGSNVFVLGRVDGALFLFTSVGYCWENLVTPDQLSERYRSDLDDTAWFLQFLEENPL